MKIDPQLLRFEDGFDGFCSAKPFGGAREKERAVDHNWEMLESDTDCLFCCYCGAGAYLKSEAKGAA